MAEIGERFGRFTITGDAPSAIWDGPDKVRRDRRAFVRCDCGTETVVLLKHLRSGASKSCGCLSRERAAERLGAKSPVYIHGRSNDPTWQSWRSMWARCRNPKVDGWHRYGGRGITVCDRWLSFVAFLEDMGDRPAGKTIDRIDPDGNYEPANCRWATPKEQRANQSHIEWPDRNGTDESEAA